VGLQMRKGALLVQKVSGFSKFMVCLHGQGGKVEPVRTFFGLVEKGSIFRDFVRTSFIVGFCTIAFNLVLHSNFLGPTYKKCHNFQIFQLRASSQKEIPKAHHLIDTRVWSCIFYSVSFYWRIKMRKIYCMS